MTIHDQLRDAARRADRHQAAITADEILRRASAHGTGSRSRTNSRHEIVHQMPTGLTEEEVTMIDVQSSNDNTAHDRPQPKRILLAVAAAAAAVVVIAVVAIRGGDDGNPSPGGGDGTRIVAEATDVEFVGNVGLEGQTFSVQAQEQGGTITGQFRISSNVIDIQCADTSRDGFVILGGAAVSGPDVKVGDLLAVVIREGNPDAVSLLGGDGAGTCEALLASMPADYLTNDGNFAIVEDGYDIVTG